MSPYVRCDKCGQSLRPDYHHDTDDGRRILLGRCQKCGTQCVLTIRRATVP